MKEYRLTSWPELASPFQRTAFRRMASDMSHRFMTLAQLASTSGLKRHEVRRFVETLEGRGVLVERESMSAASQFWSLRPLGGWVKRVISSARPER
jgi:hypothetical protein